MGIPMLELYKFNAPQPYHFIILSLLVTQGTGKGDDK